jgi:DNA-binding transcriptional ArsR family regulator
MGISKTENFSERQKNIANLAKALGHPARIAILEYLIKTAGTCICGDIVNELPLAQPTVSQHLKELKAAGWIKGNVEGKTICYCINEKTVAHFGEYFSNILTKLSEENNDCCTQNKI